MKRRKKTEAVAQAGQNGLPRRREFSGKLRYHLESRTRGGTGTPNRIPFMGTFGVQGESQDRN